MVRYIYEIKPTSVFHYSGILPVHVCVIDTHSHSILPFLHSSSLVLVIYFTIPKPFPSLSSNIFLHFSFASNISSASAVTAPLILSLSVACAYVSVLLKCLNNLSSFLERRVSRFQRDIDNYPFDLVFEILCFSFISFVVLLLLL